MHNPTSPTDQDSRPDSRRDEAGFILAQAALLLVPLLIFAAFATDIGSWYLKGQQVQRGADAAALAGVTFLPDVSAAEAEARAVAARNGFLDATPGDNTDFESGPVPQIRVTSHGGGSLEVEIKTEAPAFLGQLVVDSIVVERYGVAEFIKPVYLGNPTSGLGTGQIPEADLGLPNDNMWLAVNAYCSDHEQGDQFTAGYYDGPAPINGYQTCGDNPNEVEPEASPNPTFDPDAYIFVAEYKAGSPALDLAIYEPGTGCSGSGETEDSTYGPILNIEVYGPSATTDHRGFIAANAPIAAPEFFWDACIGNSPSGDGWWPLLDNASTPSSEGGYYYIKITARSPVNPGPFAALDSFWAENGSNQFSLRALKDGDTKLCAFSASNPTCPQLYALEWLPLHRNIPDDESPFYFAEITESHAGDTMLITFFDAAEGVDNLQFVDSNGTAMPFRWRYSDTTDGQLSSAGYFETTFTNYTDTCSWAGVGGNPCLDTSDRDFFNDHFVRIEIDIPDDYTCGVDCWWQVRYTTGGSPNDRSNWAVKLSGDPVRLVE